MVEKYFLRGSILLGTWVSFVCHVNMLTKYLIEKRRNDQIDLWNLFLGTKLIDFQI